MKARGGAIFRVGAGFLRQQGAVGIFEKNAPPNIELYLSNFRGALQTGSPFLMEMQHGIAEANPYADKAAI